MSKFSNGWTTRICEAILSADQPKRVQHKTWHRALAHADGERVCDYCQRKIDRATPRNAVIDYLVPLQLGGPAVNENRVLACPSCARSKGHKDLVSWKAFASKGTEQSRQLLLAERSKVLATALNHLTHTRINAPKATVLRELERRWSNPRFTVYAVHGSASSFIGWTKRNGAKEAHGLAAVLLRFQCQAVPVSSGKVVLYELPSDQFLDAVWLLIEHHALVKKLDVDGVEPAPHDLENWQHHWHVHLEHLSDLCLRRVRRQGSNPLKRGSAANARAQFNAHGTLPDPRHLVEVVHPAPAPRKPRVLSEKREAIAKRERRKVDGELARRQAFLEARAVLDHFKARVSRGEVEAPTAQELDWMEREVLDLL